MQRRVRGDERDARKERAARADVLAVPGAALADHVEHCQRQDYHKAHQHDIAQILEHPVAGQTLELFREGYLVQQVLHKPEGAEPAADKAAQHRAEKQQETHDIEREPVVPVAQHGLQRTYGAGAERTRAGVAVEARDADAL